MSKNTKTPVMVLQELSIKKHMAPPTYTIVQSFMEAPETRFDYKVQFGSYAAEGTGSSKQIAKHDAAHKMLLMLADYGIYNPQQDPVEEFNASIKKNLKQGEDTSLKYITALSEYCTENKLYDPVYVEISDVGPPHAKQFTYTCQVASLTTQATGNTKKSAKHLAAKQMLEQLKDIVPERRQEQGLLRDDKAIEEPKSTETTEQDLRALERGAFLLSIQPDLCVHLDDYGNTIKKLMVERNLTIEDFEPYLKEATEENLQEICDKLELQYQILQIQQKPVLLSISLSTGTPFTIIGTGMNLEVAKLSCLNQVFKYLRFYMEIEIE